MIIGRCVMTKSDLRIEAERQVSGLPSSKQSIRKDILKKSVDILNNAEKERLQVAGIESSKGVQPCGHSLDAIQETAGGAEFCAACEDPEYYHFEQWYKSQENRFRTGQFSFEEGAYAAFRYGVEYGMHLVYGATWGGYK